MVTSITSIQLPIIMYPGSSFQWHKGILTAESQIQLNLQNGKTRIFFIYTVYITAHQQSAEVYVLNHICLSFLSSNAGS